MHMYYLKVSAELCLCYTTSADVKSFVCAVRGLALTKHQVFNVNYMLIGAPIRIRLQLPRVKRSAGSPIKVKTAQYDIVGKIMNYQVHTWIQKYAWYLVRLIQYRCPIVPDSRMACFCHYYHNNWTLKSTISLQELTQQIHFYQTRFNLYRSTV